MPPKSVAKNLGLFIPTLYRCVPASWQPLARFIFRFLRRPLNANTLRGPHVGYVLPDVPMLPNTTYSVTVSGTNDGKAFTRNLGSSQKKEKIVR